jgi:hypothetical protein
VDAGYGTDRLPIYVHVRPALRRSFQAVVYWSGWDTFALKDVDEYFARQIDFSEKRARLSRSS